MHITTSDTDLLHHNLKELAVAVLSRAVRDAQGEINWIKSAHLVDRRKKTTVLEDWYVESTKKWILNSRDCEMWCDIVGIEPEALRQKVREYDKGNL